MAARWPGSETNSARREVERAALPAEAALPAGDLRPDGGELLADMAAV